MTSLESLVPSLALCQQLKAAGFPQDTAMVWVQMPVGWVNGGGGVPYVAVGGYVNRVQSREITLGTLSERLCAAPTAGELEEWLMQKGYDVHTVFNRWGGYLVSAKRNDDEEHLSKFIPTHVAALADLVLEVAG